MEKLQHSAHIDWLSLVIRTKPLDPGYHPKDLPLRIRKAILNELGKEIVDAMIVTPVQRQHGRAPYRWGWTDEISKVTIWAGGDVDHFTIEIPGQACEHFRRLNLEELMLRRGHTLASRVDIAIDIQTGLTPIEIVDMRDMGRNTTSSTLNSTSGQTCYIGSMSSEHYARVYRYNEPHPRSHLLRVEAVSRRHRAKKLCQAIVDGGLHSTLATLWKETGLPGILDFDNADMALSLNADRPERDGKNTVMWLSRQAAPAFRRMVQEGHIKDAEKFLREVFLGEELAE